MFDVTRYRDQFPLLKRGIHGHPIAYLDNASTTQKPQSVIDAMTDFYTNHNANIHRGIYTLSEEATEMYEGARRAVADWIGARSEEIVFTKNTTEAINLFVQSWGESHVGTDDEVLVTELEHHANLVPWQELCRRKGAHLRVVPIQEDGTFSSEDVVALLTPRVKVFALTGMSNVLGTLPPLKEIIAKAHAAGVLVFVDGAQLMAHDAVSVTSLNCDAFAFSFHKLLGPTGVGVLYAKKDILAAMPPVVYGGDMIEVVEQYQAQYREAPWRFEAGTPNIAGVAGIIPAIRVLQEARLAGAEEYLSSLSLYARERIGSVDGVKILGPLHPGSIISFSFADIHPHDIATVFDTEGIAVRSGAHCAHPLMRRLGVLATTRISLHYYNTREEIDRVVIALEKARNLLAK